MPNRTHCGLRWVGDAGWAAFSDFCELGPFPGNLAPSGPGAALTPGTGGAAQGATGPRGPRPPGSCGRDRGRDPLPRLPSPRGAGSREPRPRGGAKAGRNHCPREGGSDPSLALTPARPAVPGVPPPRRRWGDHSAAAAFPVTRRSAVPPPRPAPSAPGPSPPRRGGTARARVTWPRARSAPAQEVPVAASRGASLSGVGGCDDAGPESPDRRLPGRGCGRGPGAARAAAEGAKRVHTHCSLCFLQLLTYPLSTDSVHSSRSLHNSHGSWDHFLAN